MLARFCACILTSVAAAGLPAQAASPAADSARTPATRTAEPPRQAPPAPQPWYARISLRGFTQLRYNRLLESNKSLACAACDRSIGDLGGIFLRRGRLAFSGDVSPRVSFYIQPDLGADAAGQSHYLQLRDAYFDIWLDGLKHHRVRLGQSKVPFGFENLQSSANRLALDRNDALNSGVPNERDLGAWYYWTPGASRQRFRVLTDSGLKGTGDYGVFGLGLYNGQSANRPEANNSLHAVARLAWPFRLGGGRFVEAGVQGYTGRFVLLSRTSGVTAAPEYLDERAAVFVALYPQPFGLQAEWNWGHGPAYDAATRGVASRALRGGYVQSMWRVRRGTQVVTPFARLQYYGGGKKADVDARLADVHEMETGIEWVPTAGLELTAAFTNATRTNADGTSPAPRRERGHFLRLQAQVSY